MTTTPEIEAVVEEFFKYDFIPPQVQMESPNYWQGYKDTCELIKPLLRNTLTEQYAKHEAEKTAMVAEALQKIYDEGLPNDLQRKEMAQGWGKEGSDYYNGFLEGAKAVAGTVCYAMFSIPNCGVIDKEYIAKKHGITPPPARISNNNL